MSRQQIQLANLLSNIVMAAVLTVVATMLLTPPPGIDWGAGATWEGFLATFLAAFCIGYTVGDLVPSIEWGTKLGAKLRAKPGTWGNYFFQSLILDIVMVTVIVAILVFIKLIFGGAGFSMWWTMCMKIYLPLLGIALVVILLILKPIMAIVMRRGSHGAAA